MGRLILMVRCIVVSRGRFPLVSSRRSYTIQIQGQPDKIDIQYPKSMGEFKVGDTVELSIKNIKGAREDG